ncbi:MAG TPA: acyl carrier protein [Actinomycetota bacterium]|jgi:acyl carrier protein
MVDDVKAEVSRFIHEEVLWEDDGAELSEDAPLLDGVLDSFGLRSLLSFLDERFGVSVSNSELVAENFQSIETISAFVQSKRAAGD